MPQPQYILRSYGGGADVATLVNTIGSTDTSFTIAPTTGWLEEDGNPLGTVGPFTVVIDRFTASVEKILCSSINLTTGLVTVYVSPADGWSGRGYDGTTPQAHVPGGSSAGVQTCWSAVEAQEANRAVFDLLGGGGSSLVGVPIGSSVPFNGTPLTLPANFLLEDGSAISRSTYAALFTAITVTTTGTTTNGSATITAVSSSVTPYLVAGMQVTLVNSAGAVYTIQSVTSTTIVLTSGAGVTAGTAGGVTVYPHGAGNGSTTFNLPDSRGRSKIGQGAVGTNSQPTQYVGQTVGAQTVTISQAQLPVAIGTAAAQTANSVVTDPQHTHLIDTSGSAPGGGTSYIIGSLGSSTIFTNSGSNVDHSPAWNLGANSNNASTSTGVSVATTNSTSAVTNAGGGSPVNVTSPGIGCTFIIRAQ